MAPGRGLNQGPLGPKSDALTTAPVRPTTTNSEHHKLSDVIIVDLERRHQMKAVISKKEHIFKKQSIEIYFFSQQGADHVVGDHVRTFFSLLGRQKSKVTLHFLWIV